MKDKFFAHIGALFLGVFVFAYLFNYFKYSFPIQLTVVGLGCIYYITWGIIHHASRERLTALTVLEYILVGGLIFLLLFMSLTV